MTSNAHETMPSFSGKPKATVFRYVRSRLRLAVKRWLANCGSYFLSVATPLFETTAEQRRGEDEEIASILALHEPPIPAVSCCHDIQATDYPFPSDEREP